VIASDARLGGGMSSNDQNAGENIAELQRKTRELLRAQQEAYIAAVKAWREGFGKGPPPPWPKATPSEVIPKPSELAEASYAFAAKLLADQSRFMEELSKAIAGSKKKSS
jgi:hypothetical protein